jgi:hypothetical protein
MRLRTSITCVLLALALGLSSLPAVAAPPAGGFYGVQLDDSVAELTTLPLASAAGVRLLRFNLRWADVESADSNPPAYNWALYDRLIGEETAAGFQLIITVRDNPSWAATTSCGPIDKVPTARFIAFLSALVNRYGKPPYNVKLWELYNEPDNNHPEFAGQGGCWGQHAAAYAALLSQAQPAIKAADPDAKLVLGGLAYDFIEGVDAGGIFNRYFLRDLLASPGGKSFDIMNFHYYRAFHARWDPYGRDVIGKTNFIRGQLISNGALRPIMVTEIGHPSAGPAGDGQDYSDAASSRYVVQGLTRGRAADLYAMVWYQMTDVPADPRKYGLLLADHTPKPAYYAYQINTAELGAATYLGQENAAGLETYLFDAGDRQKRVAWSSDDLTHTLTITATAIWVVDKLGGRRIIGDGGPADQDAARDGKVALAVGVEPYYVYPALPADTPLRVFLPALRCGP